MDIQLLTTFQTSVDAAKRKQKLSLPSGRQIEQREEKSKHLGHSANSGVVGDNSSSVLSWGLLPAGTQTQQGLPLGDFYLVFFFFLSFLNSYLFIYLSIFGCIGSLLLRTGFL